MRHFFTTSLIALALAISATGAAPVAHAVDFSSFNTDSSGFGANSSGVAQPTAGQSSVAPTSGPLQSTAANPVTSVEAATTNIQNATASTQTTPGPDQANDFTPKDSEGFGKAMTWIMSLFAWLLGVSAMTLDYSVYYTVVTMGNYVHDLAAVGVTWRILRDIGNILIIFGFLAIGISTILNTERIGYGKKMLPSLIMAAVLLNFSLFMTEAVIDVGNLFATQFYTQINGGEIAGLKSFEPGSVRVSSEGISNKIMAQLGLQTIYTRARDNQQIFDGGNTWLIAFMGILLFITTAFVMFSLAFILIARFIMLLFLIIISPVGFAGFAVPQLKKLSDWWKDELITNTITAPVLLLCLYVALAIITDASFLTGFGGNGGSWDGFVAGKNLPGFASLLLSFVVAMGLLIAVIIISKKLGGFGASHATKFAGALTFGATAWGASRTLGRGAYYAGRGLRQSKTFNKFDAFTGRATSRVLDKAATGSFDIRGTSLFKELPGHIEAGEAVKDGFVGARKRNIEDHEKAAKAIETAHKDAFRENPEEVMAAENAKNDLKKAKDGQAIVQKEHKDASKEVEDRQAEVAKIEAEKIISPDRDARLAAARNNLEVSTKKQAGLADSLGKLSDAISGLEKVEKAAKDVVEEREKKNKESIKAGKTAYAEGVGSPLNLVSLVAYGPGGGAAAKKIKDSMKEKSSKDKLEDLIKDYAKEEAKREKEAEHKEGKKDSGGHAETPKEKPAESHAPAGGGHDDHGHSH